MTAYDLRISDWSSDVCSSDRRTAGAGATKGQDLAFRAIQRLFHRVELPGGKPGMRDWNGGIGHPRRPRRFLNLVAFGLIGRLMVWAVIDKQFYAQRLCRSEERSVGKECVSTCELRGSPDL